MSEYRSYDPQAMELAHLHQLMNSSVGPRPIAFASTLDAEGRPNLAPFSYFNLFSIRPPVMIFAPNISGRTGQDKDTALNCEQTGEVVINVVSEPMVEQMNLASTAYPPGVDEFEKAGFTPLPAERVGPARVAESPAQMECRVREVIRLSEEHAGGSGVLILAELQRLHLQASMLGEEDLPDPNRMKLIGRLGQLFYARASGESLFEVPRPRGKANVGLDGLPESVKTSTVLTANNLGRLGLLPELPEEAAVRAFAEAEQTGLLQGLRTREDYHRLAKERLEAGSELSLVWNILLAAELTPAGSSESA